MTVAQRPGAVAAVAFVDVLDHLFAPLMLEIDIDIGRFVAGFRDEAGKDHGGHFRGDGRDAKRVADNGIRRRAPALAEDVAGPGEGHHIGDGQEIGSVAELADQGQFALGQLFHPLRHTGRIAPPEPVSRKPFEPLLGRLSIRYFRGVFVSQAFDRKLAAIRDPLRIRNGVGIGVQKPAELRLGPETPLGIGLGGVAEILDHAALADAGENVRQAAAGAMVHHGIGGCGERDRKFSRQGSETAEPALIQAVISRGHGQGGRVGKAGCDCPQIGDIPAGMEDQFHLLPPFEKVGHIETTFAFLRPSPPDRQKPAEPPPSLPVSGKRDSFKPLSL